MAKEGCKIKGCKLNHSSRGFCKKHYTAFYKGFILEDGTFLPHYNPRPVYDRCKYPECHTRQIKGHGLCQKHYKWALNKRIDWDNCRVLDEKWFIKKNHRFEKIDGVKIALLRSVCKMPGCKNKDLKGQGFCKRHYSAYIHKFIDVNGNRLAQPIVRYSPDFQCGIPGCQLTHADSKMIKGLCKYHYEQYRKGFIDYNGNPLREKKKAASYKGVRCTHFDCKRQARIRGFCPQHYEHFKKGYVDKKGRKLKDPERLDNRNRVCKVKECSEPAHARHYCSHHYNQYKYHGMVGNLFKNKGHQCTAEGCDKEAKALTLCDKHYARFKKYGQTEIPRDIFKNKNKRCNADNCLKEAKVKGYCNTHYNRLRLTGKLDTTRQLVNKGKLCNGGGCERPAKKRGYCGYHYYWLVEKPRKQERRERRRLDKQITQIRRGSTDDLQREETSS